MPPEDPFTYLAKHLAEIESRLVPCAIALAAIRAHREPTTCEILESLTLITEEFANHIREGHYQNLRNNLAGIVAKHTGGQE